MYDDTRLVYTTAMQKDFEGNLGGFVILRFSFGLFVPHLSERGNRYYFMRGKKSFGLTTYVMSYIIIDFWIFFLQIFEEPKENLPIICNIIS